MGGTAAERVVVATSGPAFDAARTGGRLAGRPLEPDEALGKLSAVIAARVAADPEHRPPDARALRALGWYVGLSDPVPAVLAVKFHGDVRESGVGRSVRDACLDEDYNRVGVAEARADDGAEIVAVALSKRRVAFVTAPPRRADVGSVVRVAGRLLGSVHSPHLAVTRPDGGVDARQLGDGQAFTADLTLADPGIYQVELLGEDARGPTVVANVPVYVGVAPPASPPTPPPALAPARDQTPAEAEADLLAMTNAARRAAGLSPVLPLPRLAVEARTHSAEMAAGHFVAHHSLAKGGPVERVRGTGLPADYVVENVARAASAAEAHDGLMDSPGHRANILDEHVTHVGIGVVRDATADRSIFVTEEFLTIAPRIDVAAAPDRLLEMVNRARAARHLGPLRADATLAQIAEQAATRFFATDLPPRAVVAGAGAAFSVLPTGFTRAEVVGQSALRLDDAAIHPAFFDPAATDVGVGVAQGSRPDAPTNGVFALFVLGYPPLRSVVRRGRSTTRR